MSIFNLVGALVITASLSANAYYFWPGRDLPPSTFKPTDGPIVLRVKGGLLEVSTIRAPEQFDASTDETILGVPLGKTVTQIRVPAVYRYHVELGPEWKLLLRDKTFIVISPPVKPSLPVSIDTANLEAHSSGRWSMLTGDARIAELQKSITRRLAAKAATPTYVQFQREAARQTLKEFVAKWLVTQEKWNLASSYPIKVYFADEPIQALRTMPQPFGGLPL